MHELRWPNGPDRQLIHPTHYFRLPSRAQGLNLFLRYLLKLALMKLTGRYFSTIYMIKFLDAYGAIYKN
jgi:hypothetical protein